MNILVQFKKYLQNRQLSPISVKNYLSDTRKFLHWKKNRSKAGQPRAGDFNLKDFENYYYFLVKTKTPQVIKRYLSSLRLFSQFLFQRGLLGKNPELLFISISQMAVTASTGDPKILLDRFERFLIKEKFAPVTIKNYLVDVRQFLEWRTKNKWNH
jgi:site-specific recombinase XerD